MIWPNSWALTTRDYLACAKVGGRGAYRKGKEAISLGFRVLGFRVLGFGVSGLGF